LNAGNSQAAVIRGLLRKSRFAVLATCGRRGPHASLVAVLAVPESGALVFVTPRGTLKYRNLAAEPRAAMLLSRQPGRSGGRGAALTVSGRARELRGGQADLWLKRFLRRHPGLKGIAGSRDCAVFMLRPARLSLATGVRRVSRASPASIRRKT